VQIGTTAHASRAKQLPPIMCTQNRGVELSLAAELQIDRAMKGVEEIGIALLQFCPSNPPGALIYRLCCNIIISLN